MAGRTRQLRPLDATHVLPDPLLEVNLTALLPGLVLKMHAQCVVQDLLIHSYPTCALICQILVVAVDRQPTQNLCTMVAQTKPNLGGDLQRKMQRALQVPMKQTRQGLL